jgi:tRNA U34 5-methylaminomethyl-2-thiouridine-forming methyltransferase MnmC
LHQIVTTSDGSNTLYVPELDEHYHSVFGAVQESEYIFIRNGFDFCRNDPIHIFETGFGTGLNALLTAVQSINENREVFYTSIEKYPLDKKITGSLNYPEFVGKDGKRIFNLIHSERWGEMSNIFKRFNLHKIKGDMTTYNSSGSFNLIYFDAFSPDKQPEMWTKEIFMKISEITVSKGIFVTYSAKGEVKRNLKAAGFDVALIPGPPGKRQIIQAVKI